MGFIYRCSLSLFFTSLLCASAYAHGGGLNAQGCHNNRKTGGYHCHRAPAKPAYKRTAPQQYNSSGISSFSRSQNTEIILTAQYMLSGLGYDVGIPDGILGVKTQQAILGFQREQSLLPTGRADQTLILNLAKVTQKQLQKVG